MTLARHRLGQCAVYVAPPPLPPAALQCSPSRISGRRSELTKRNTKLLVNAILKDEIAQIHAFSQVSLISSMQRFYVAHLRTGLALMLCVCESALGHPDTGAV